MLFIGDDWAEDHHDIAVLDEAGRVLAQRRLTEGVAGLEALHDLLGGYLPEDAAPAEVLVGIETDRGPWVQGLLASGYTVYAINPAQSARYRQRTGAAGAKSDKGDALVLARIVAVDRELHRAVTADSGVAEKVKVLARAHQSLIWARRRQANVLRSNLREYYPAALAAFGHDLHGRDAMAVLGAAPGPNAGARLTPARVQALLRHAGRQRYVAARSGEIVEALHSPQLPARPGIEAAYTATTAALVAVIRELNTQIGVLQGQVEESFGRHPDAEVYLSQPGRGRCSAPGCWANSGTRRTATPTPDRAGTTPGPARSPGHPAPSAACWPGMPETGGWPMPWTCRPSPHSAPHPAHAPTTTPAAHAAPPTTRPSAPWPTGSSGSSTAASATTPPTTRTSRGTPQPQTLNYAPLDNLEPWGI